MSESPQKSESAGSWSNTGSSDSNSVTCPERSDLQSFLFDGLDERNTAQVIQHVDTCVRCQDTLANLTGEFEFPSTKPVPPFLTRLKKSDPNSLDDDDWIDRFLGGGTLVGSCKVEEEIGRGAMGIVFRGIDTHLDRPVAIKFMRPSLCARETYRTRFLREAQSMAKIDHPNVVPIYHVGQHEGIPFVAMKWLQGETLRERLERLGPIQNEALRKLVVHAAAGLQAVHDQGLVHRDIKPANLFLESPDDQVRLLDFGLTHVEDSTHVTKADTLLGSPAYMSPEQASGEIVDTRSDLFSLGTTLYEAACGKMPFSGESALAVMNKLVSAAPVSIRKRVPSIHEDIAEQITKLLEKAPERRPASAEQVRSSLQASPDSAIPRGVSRRLVGVAITAVLMAVVIFRMQTPEGELTVELADGVDPDRIAIEAVGEGNVKLLNADQGWTIHVLEGNYSVRMTNGADRFQLDKGSITVRDSEKEYLKVTLREKRLQELRSTRDVAKWILSVGGQVTVSTPKPFSVVNVENMPDEFEGIHAIDLRDTSVSEKDLMRLPRMASLRKLSLGTNGGSPSGLTGQALELFTKTPHLIELQLSGISVGQEGMQKIGTLASLESLSIKNGDVYDDDLHHLSHLSQLKQLELHATTGTQSSLTGEGLQHLDACELTLLSLAQSTLQADAIASMPAWRTLQTLRLNPMYRDDWTKETVESLGRFPRLKDLHLKLVALNHSSALRQLPKFADLKTLMLSSTKAVDDSVVEQWIIKMPQLEVLSLANTSVTDASLRHIEAIPSLRFLFLLDSSNLSDAAIKRFQTAKPGCKIQRIRGSK